MRSNLIAVNARFVVAFGLLQLLPPAGAAADIRSVYTSLKLADCRNITPPEVAEIGGVIECDGYAGTRVRIAEGDLRMFVSYGAGAETHTAASQTLPAFNTTGETLEWRLANGVPFATILRFYWDSDGNKGSTLVVTKLSAADSCHVAHVQATSNPNANALARDLADDRAPAFDCKYDRVQTYGPGGKRID